MRSRRAACFGGWVLLALLLLIVVTRAEEGAEAPHRDHLARGDRLLALWETDRDAFASAARGPLGDAFLVADRLLERAQAAGEDVDLEVVDAFVAAREETPDHAALASWADAWRRAEPADHARELRVRALAEQASRDRWRFTAGRRAILAEAEEHAADLEAAFPASLNALRFRLRAELARGGAATVASALENLQALLADAERLGWSALAGEIAGIRASVLLNDGRLDEGIALRRRAIVHLERANLPRSAAQVRVTLASNLRRALELEEALEEGTAARATLEALGDRGGCARATWILASIHVGLGDVPSAVPLFEQAIEDAADTVQAGWIPHMQLELADAHRRLGRYAEALEGLDRIAGSPVSARSPALRALGLAYRGSVLHALGLEDEALARLREAEALVPAGRHGSTRALVLGRLGPLLAARGDLEAAVETLRASRDLSEARGNPAEVVTADLLLAGLETRREHTDAAREHLARARAGAMRHGLGAPLVLARLTEARLLAAEDQPDEARRALETLLLDLERLRLPRPWVAAVHQDLAALAAEHGPRTAVLQHVHEALELRRGERGGLDDVEALGLRRSTAKLLDLGLDAATTARAAHPLLEAGRAVLLAERVGTSAAAGSPDARRAEAVARHRLAAAQRRLVRLAFGAATPSTAALAEARAALDAAHAAHARTRRGLARETDPARGAVATVSFEDLPRGAGRAWIAFHVGPERSRALVAAEGGAAFVDLGASDDVRRAVEAWLAQVVTDTIDDEAAAATCYDLLIRPLEPWLGNATRWLVSPDDVLAYLPFDALVRREDGTATRVVDRCEVVLVPSATVLARLEAATQGRAAGRRVVALGDPVYPGEAATPPPLLALRGIAALPRLPESGREAEAVASLFPPEARTLLRREDATVRSLLEAATGGEDAQPLAALHLACHAFVDRARPRLSGLVLADGEVLSAAAIERQHLAADLVVLSACDTGRGVIARGEGVMGLTRAFFRAGVPRVVVSNWPVDDASTRRLMEAFYAGMRSEGLPPAAALAAAKRSMRRLGGDAAHPFHWAAFSFWGRPDG